MVCFAARQCYGYVIPRPNGPWESPGTMFVVAECIDELYLEIATSLRSSQ